MPNNPFKVQQFPRGLLRVTSNCPADYRIDVVSAFRKHFKKAIEEKLYGEPTTNITNQEHNHD